MLKEKKIQVGKYKINYVDEGQGMPMIFLHNGGGFWHSWQYQLEHFSNTNRVIALDWVGFGESDEPDEGMTLELNYRTLRGFTEALNLDRFVLVGNCIGASTAIRYHQLHPKEVEKLILFNVCPGRRMLGPKFFQKFMIGVINSPILRAINNKILGAIFLHTSVKRKFPRILFGASIDTKDPLYQRYVEKLKQPRQTRGRLNLLNSVNSFTLEDFIDQEKLPIDPLIIWGEQNHVVRLKKEAKHHLDLLQTEQMTIIPEGGHLCMYEFPEMVNRVMQRAIT